MAFIPTTNIESAAERFIKSRRKSRKGSLLCFSRESVIQLGRVVFSLHKRHHLSSYPDSNNQIVNKLEYELYGATVMKKALPRNAEHQAAEIMSLDLQSTHLVSRKFIC